MAVSQVCHAKLSLRPNSGIQELDLLFWQRLLGRSDLMPVVFRRSQTRLAGSFYFGACVGKYRISR
jgi:hypothetical protein